MTWENYLKAISDEDIDDWESALKAFTKKGKELGIPLSVIELLKRQLMRVNNYVLGFID